MATITKAVLMNLGVFLADNGVRRNLSSLTFNYPSTSASITNQQFTLDVGETYTWNTPTSMLPSAMTLIVCSESLDASLIFSAIPPATVAPAAYGCVISKLHVTDQSLSQLTLVNNGTVASKVIILQA